MAPWSETSINVQVPILPPGVYDVVVTTAGGPSAPVQVNVMAPVPVISSLSPSNVRPGATLTVSGQNFGATQGTSAVTINGVLTLVV